MMNRSMCPCSKLGPIVIIILGIMWLLGSLGYITWQTASILLPILVIIVGIKKMIKCNNCDRCVDGKCCVNGKCDTGRCVDGKCETKPMQDK